MKNFNKLTAFAAIALAAAFTTPIMAQTAVPQYTYAAAQYTNNNLKNTDGYVVSGSAALGSNLYVLGDYRDGLDTRGNTGTAAAGLGLHLPLVTGTDVFAQVEATTLVAPHQNDRKYGFRSEAGVRSQLNDRWEVRGGVVASNSNYRNKDTTLWYGTVGTEYSLTDNLHLTLDVLGKQDFTQGLIGARWYF